MKDLHISDNLSLPIDAATQTFAFIARKRSGKTYTAGKLVECFLDAQVQVVILDTVGNWYGLRLSSDGKSSGYDIAVLGGLRGDIPLEATSGHLIADIAIESGKSLILDISQFSLADRKRFATAFGERLWSGKKAERHPVPVHLVIEESQLIIPQFTGRGDGSAHMVGIYEEIIRLGGNYGIGVSMISQRPQSVNKEVLNQTECLFVGQVNGSQERDALKKWITHQGMDVHLVDELPSLPVGVFYVWSPQWLQILRKVKIGKKKTFDASATPKVGSHQVRRDLKALDLDDLKERMAETIERAKADDPRELRKEIAALKKQIGKASPEQRTDPALSRQLERARQVLGEAMKFIVKINATDFSGDGIDENAIKSAIGAAMGEIKKSIALKLSARDSELQKLRKEGLAIVRRLGALTEDQPIEVAVTVRHNKPFTVSPAPQSAPRATAMATNGDKPLPKGEREILAALIQYPDGLERSQIGVLTGHVKRSTRDAYIYRLSTKGFVVAEQGQKVLATQEGIDALPDAEPLPTGVALQDYWLSRLPGGEDEILRFLIENYPDAVSREAISEATGYDKRSTRDAYIYRLSQKQLVVSTSNGVTASKNLF